MRQELTLTVENLSNQGAGVARFEGLAIFVPGALPGERVRVRLTRHKKRYALAELREILVAAPQRRQPPCPIHECCGGCGLQHLAYEQQLFWKRKWLEDALQRLGGLQIPVLPMLAGQPFAYRNRVQLHLDWQGRVAKLGFYRQGSHSTVAPPGGCFLMRPLLRRLAAVLEQCLPAYRQTLGDLQHIVLRCNHDESAALVSFVGQEDNPALQELSRELMTAEPRLVSLWANWGQSAYGVYGPQWRHLAGVEQLPEQLGPLRLRLSPAAFTQVNPEQTLRLYDQVAAYARLTDQDQLLDLYSGVGSIALFLAGQCASVVGVEEYAPAVVDARSNASLNDCTKCSFVAGRAEQLLPQWAAAGQQADVAVVDPPRAGCAAEALQALAQLRPQRIVYVSCDPGTLARDLRLLKELGYIAQEAQPLDMFPQTLHVETVVLLSLRSPNSQ